jgi:hypothetical protein
LNQRARELNRSALQELEESPASLVRVSILEAGEPWQMPATDV